MLAPPSLRVLIEIVLQPGCDFPALLLSFPLSDLPLPLLLSLAPLPFLPLPLRPGEPWRDGLLEGKAATAPPALVSQSSCGKGDGFRSSVWSAKLTRAAGGVPDLFGGGAFVITGLAPRGLAVALIPALASRKPAIRPALCFCLLAILGSTIAWAIPLVGVLDLALPDPCLEERAALRLWLRWADLDLLRGGGVSAREGPSSEPTPSP